MLKKVFSTVFRSMDMESYDPGFHFRGMSSYLLPSTTSFTLRHFFRNCYSLSSYFLSFMLVFIPLTKIGHMNKVPNNLNFSVKKRDSFQSTRMALDGSSRTHSGYFTSTAERDDCLLRKPANQGNFGNLLFVSLLLAAIIEHVLSSLLNSLIF